GACARRQSAGDGVLCPRHTAGPGRATCSRPVCQARHLSPGQRLSGVDRRSSRAARLRAARRGLEQRNDRRKSRHQGAAAVRARHPHGIGQRAGAALLAASLATRLAAVGIIMAINGGYLGVLAWLLQRERVREVYARYRPAMEIMFGVLFVLFGARLALRELAGWLWPPAQGAM